jgi:hypothetical protein
MKNTKMIGITSLFLGSAISLGAHAQEIVCDDGAGSILEVLQNPNKEAQANTLILLEGPAADYMIDPASRDFLSKRYGLNAQDYQLNADGKLVLFGGKGDPKFPLVIAAKGGRYEPQFQVRREHTGVQITDLHRHWYFGDCRASQQ